MKEYHKSAFILFIFIAAFTTTTIRAMEDMDESESMNQEQLDKELFEAIRTKTWKSVKPLLKKGANPNMELNSIFFNFPLHSVARWNNQPAIVRILLKYGADPNKKNNNNRNALHGAEFAKTMEILLKHGTDLNNQDSYGFTPLHEAWTTEQIQILLKYGADPTIRNNLRNTPLEHAIKKDKLDVATTLHDWTKEQNKYIEEAILTIKKLHPDFPNDMLNLIIDMFRKNQMGPLEQHTKKRNGISVIKKCFTRISNLCYPTGRTTAS